MNAKPVSRDVFIRSLIGGEDFTLPGGQLINNRTNEQLEALLPHIFDAIFRTASADISSLEGFGELDENHRLPCRSMEEFIREEFRDDLDNYWYHWRDMFKTTALSEDFFEDIYGRALKYAPFCEKHRHLTNGNTYFGNIVAEGDKIAFSDWSRAGVMDFMIDFVCMDLHKPWLKVPERLWEYAKQRHIPLEDFHQRFLCMAYFRGFGSLLWHTSIEDADSCRTITLYLNELEERIHKIGS